VVFEVIHFNHRSKGIEIVFLLKKIRQHWLKDDRYCQVPVRFRPSRTVNRRKLGVGAGLEHVTHSTWIA